jgi:hypothetical protein
LLKCKLPGKRHPLAERFHQILAEIGTLHDRKQQDYGLSNDPFANVRGAVDWGLPAWVGAMVRASDKLRRLQKFATTGKLANESVIDSFRDLAVYAIIAEVLYEETQKPIVATLGGVIDEYNDYVNFSDLLIAKEKKRGRSNPKSRKTARHR